MGQKKTGVFKGYDPLQCHKRLCYDEQKVAAFLPTLSDECDEDIKFKINPLPSCATTKNMHDAHKIMLNEKESKSKEEKKQLLVDIIKLAKASKDAGIGDLMGEDTLVPQSVYT